LPFLSASGLGRASRQYILAMGLVNLAFFMSQAYFIFYLQSNGLSFLQMSVIYALNFIMCAALGLPMGNLADRYGRRDLFSAGIVVMAIGMLIYAFTRTFESFIVAEVFFALGWTMVNGSNEAWVVDQLAIDKRAGEAPKAFTVMMSLSYLLGIVGGGLASMLVLISLNMPFLGAAIILLFCAVLVWKRLPENFGSRVTDLRTILKDSLSFYSQDRRLQFLTAAETFRYIASVIYLFLYQPYLVATGLGEGFLGIYFSVLMLCSAAGSLLSPHLGSRIGHHRVMVLSSAGLFAAFVLLTLSPGLAASVALFALCGLANGLGWPSLMVWRNSIVPSAIRASSLSLFSSFTYLAGAVVSMVLGAILDASDMSVGFVFAALISITAVPLFLNAKNKKYERVPSPLTPSGGGAQQM
jgi:MFS family permease